MPTTTILYPSTLPQKLHYKTTSKLLTPSFIETQMNGPSKRRRRYTGIVRLIEVPSNTYVVTDAQRVVLYAFYDNTLGGGALAFLWQDPIPGWGRVVCRYVERPTEACLVPGDGFSRLWAANFKLEVLPDGHPGDVGGS